MVGDDIGIDAAKIKKFFKNRNFKKFSFVLFLLIPLLLSVFFRIQPAYLPKTDDWAQQSLYNGIKSDLRNKLNSQFPNLPESNKVAKVNEQFQAVIAGGKINLGNQEVGIQDFIDQNSNEIKKQFQNANGQTYLLAIDPYYYYRHTRNLINLGYEDDAVDKNGKYYDSKILAGTPDRVGQNKKIRNLHVYLQAELYKIINALHPGVDLMSVVFFVPVIIGTLTVIPAFFIARKIAGNIGGLFAGILIAIHPAFLSRTIGGFSDTDAYNVLFPLLIMWLLIEALESKNRNWLYAGLSGIAVGLFSFAWIGWIFIFNIGIALCVGMMGYYILRNWNKLKNIARDVKIRNTGLVAVVYFVSSAFFVILLKGLSEFTRFFSDIILFTKIKDVGISKIWPNVYTTVAELNPASLNSTISQTSLGSKLWLLVGLLGIIMPLILTKMNKTHKLYLGIGSAVWFLFMISIQKSITSHIFFAGMLFVPLAAWMVFSVLTSTKLDMKYSIILAIWIAAVIYASSKGVRFILLLVPAFSVSAGITVGIVSKMLSDAFSRGLNINKIISQAMVLLLFGALLFYPTNFVKAANDVAENEVPSMNDDWWNTLTKINKESSQDAIINSWWDFGHWFAAIGNRSVTLDGGRQNNPQAHWLGKLLLTWNETESVGILRYLDCGANTGFNRLLDYMDGDGLRTINTIYEIIVVDRDKARDILLGQGLNSEQADSILEVTHCNPPEDYLITSEDMVGKSGVWAHFGAWNFTKAVMYNQVHDKTETEGVGILENGFGLDESTAIRVYSEIINTNPDQWISPWPGYAGSSRCSMTDNIVKCQDGVTFDFNSEKADIQTQNGVMHPKTVAYMKDGKFKIRNYQENILTLPQTNRFLGVALVPNGNQFISVLMDSDLTGSMFTRLFYFENSDGGLTHFDNFNQVTDVTGQKIIVWKVDWDGKELNNTTVDQTVDQSKTTLRVKHILISTSNRTIEDAQKIAEDIESRINPSNFDEISKEYSDCSPDTVECNLPWISKGDIDGFDDVFDMQVGEISKPFETEYGIEIVMVFGSK